MKISNIVDVHKILHKEALQGNFYKNNKDELDKYAYGFVDSICLKHGLTAHTVSPFRWTFESSGHGMIDDGMIELCNLDTDDTVFKYVDVSEAKITDENNTLGK